MKSRRELISSTRKSSRLAQRRRKAFLVKTFALFFLLFGLAGFLVWASGDDRVTINDVEIRGAQYVGEEGLISIIEEKISGKYLWLLPKENIFLYPRKDIVANVLSSYKRIEEAEVRIDDFEKVVLSITERRPFYTWCGEQESEEEALKECFFVDSKGYIFDVSPRFSNSVYFEFYGALDGDDDETTNVKNNPVGSRFLAPHEFEKIIAFKNELAKANVETHRFKALSGGDYKFIADNGGSIIFHKKQDFQKVLENLKSALSVEDLSGSLEKANLKYIDLRFGNKVFYKFGE